MKVIIVGGSITGLTLANMLERIGVDYVLLEAHSEIAPQVGASIGMWPYGLRILDQLGCYEPIRALIDKPLERGVLVGPDGKPLLTTENLSDHIEERHGYPVIFVDRQAVLQILYDNINDKSKVLLNKRVATVTQRASSIGVTLKDGSSHFGDIVVGADGIHSTVRSEMWRIAETAKPGYIPASERTDVPTKYNCIFGISKPTPGLPLQTAFNVLRKDYSYLVITGPGGRVYWFVFTRLPETQHGAIPRYSKEDEEELVKRYRDDRVYEDVRFSEIYKNKLSSVLTAIPEYVFKKWYFGRVITIGDSAHKLNPLPGQGGNSAIETSAAFVNALFRQLKSSPTALSQADIEHIFSETQNVRHNRAWEVVSYAHDQQKVEAMETPALGLFARWILPRLERETAMSRFADVISAGVRLEMLPLPERPRWIPYHDELPAKQMGGGRLAAVAAACFFAALAYTAKVALALSLPDEPLRFLGSPLRATYTGVHLLDEWFRTLVFAFARGVAGPDAGLRIMVVYFLSMLLPITTVWIVEAYRLGNKRTPLAWPSLWTAAYQLRGIGLVAPIYYLVSVFTSSHRAYEHLSGRPVPEAVAKAIVPAVVLGYAIPTALMFLPYGSAAVVQNAIATWQPAPVLACALVWALAHLLGSSHRGGGPLAMYSKRETEHLRSAYLTTFVVAAIVHAAVFVYLVVDPDMSFRQAVRFVLPPPHGRISSQDDFDSAMSNFWRIWSMRRRGYISTAQAGRAVAAVVCGQVLVGPGATYAGLWYWRENCLSALSKSSSELAKSAPL
ncbi:FAD binding domain containing protein [Lasiodiplodia theobromae]|uniref:FAD binding domain containing protein n=1 Tax=Lasiodiplodia theobromae TaxID=45133 RepID=UPI0015C3403F|nr:FAD binding domain containing protein [Lasiodiplodia theobromae]KAF4545414.1 FAD binding domain containing protein [Lasiodiplodia theobromae]